ncbi:MAG: hypothetical protein AABM31_09580 [Actinomycetota bacterium]
MADRDILERFDAHMERGNELMDRVEEQMRLTREFHRVELPEHREFLRQMILRVERIGGDQWRELSRLNDELERQGAEGREESRVERNALLKILDRLDRIDPPPAAA